MIRETTTAPSEGSARTPIDQALDHLETLVLDELRPGASLPAEGELARQLRVSRLTVREAVKILAGRGLVEVRQGRRPTVAQPSGAVIGSYFSAMLRRDAGALLELLEVRQALEIRTAALAASQRSPEALAALESAFEQMRAAQSAEALHAADVRYHQALAFGSGNRMLRFLQEGLEVPLHESFAASYAGHHFRGAGFDELLASHAAVLERIREADEQGAANAMRTHLEQVEIDLRAALAHGVELGTSSSDPS